MAGKPIVYYLAPPVLMLCAELVAANWYLRPERAAAWAAAAVLLVCMAAAYLIGGRTSKGGDSGGRASVSSHIVFAGMIVAFSLSAALASTLGALTAEDLALRASMVTMGAVLVFTGNAVPKTLKPLSDLKCDAATVQAFQRFAGWTWVAAGLAWVFAWLVLPVDVANPLAALLLGTGTLLVAVQYVRLFRRSQRLG